MGQVTMDDVAEKAGVSRSAVTAAFSERASTAGIARETRLRILDAAKELGYWPNILSRSFIKQQSFLIGMLGREAFFLFAMQTIKGIEDVLEPTDYSLLTVYNGDWAEDQAKHLRKSVSRRVDAIIIVGAPEEPDGPNHHTVRQLQERGVPIVQLYRRMYPNVPVVMMDDEATGYLATRHLVEQGHQRIAHVTHEGYLDEELPGKYADAFARYRGYRRAMEEAGLRPRALPFARRRYGLGENDYADECKTVARELAFGKQGFTAATTFNDYVVIGLIHCLDAMGVSVPRDISLVGYDNVEAGNLIRPSVTTVKPTLTELGRSAAEKILALLDGQAVEDTVFAPQLVVRQSTGPVRSQPFLSGH
jgi:LacI family transcriptional regulator